jgi:hypothetical protein
MTGPAGGTGGTGGTGGGGGGGGATDICVLLDKSTDSPNDSAKGAFSFDSNDYSTATTIKFKATGYTTNVSAALTGTLTLYNKTDSAAVTSGALTFNSVTMGQQITVDIKANLPASLKVYELRLKVTGGGGPGSQDLLVIESAYMEIR